MRWLRRLRYALRQWWECRAQQCDYYTHYLAWGPAEMPHATWHHLMQQAIEHFEHCRYQPKLVEGWKADLCPRCLSFEKRIRA